MSEHYIFKTYNQLNKKFEVHVMLINNQYQFKLVKKPDQPDKPKPPRDSKPPKWFREFVDNQFKPLITKIDNLIQKNNLVE